MSMSVLSFFMLILNTFRHIFLAPSPILMILLLDLWYFDDTSPSIFLEKSHFAKVLNINDIIQYLSRKMILWDFFREKTFLREHAELSFVLQFSAERNNFFIKNSWNSCVFQTKLVYLHQLMKKRLHCQAEVSVNIDVDCECITKLLKYKTWNHEENL